MSTRPDDIPQDVWDRAYKAVYRGDWIVVEQVARAILAAKAEEREACATLALDEAGRWTSNDSNANEAWACGRVASAIRKRGDNVNTAHKLKTEA